MTLKQQKIKRKLLKELGILRRKRERLITQVEALKEYKKVLRENLRRKIPTRNPNQSNSPETSASISIFS